MDTIFTYTTSRAPFGDVVLVIAVPLVVLTSLALLAFGVTRVWGRPEQLPRAVEGTLLMAPVLLYGVRGCFSACDADVRSLLERWLPTALLGAILIVTRARQSASWSPIRFLLILAAATQVLAALAFSIRTDEVAMASRETLLLSATVLLALATAWLAGLPRRVSSARRVALVIAALAVAIAWPLRAVPPHLPAIASNASVAGRPNVLLIILDTVRADHLSLYGYPRRTSPHLDALGADSLVFDRARANATYSLASHASLFTGLLPSRHGARPIPRNWKDRHPTVNLPVHDFPVRSDVANLARDLTGLGYVTAGISANDVYLAPWTGLQRGFAAFEAKIRRRYRYFPLSAPFVARMLPYLGVVAAKSFEDTWAAPDITDAAISWLQTGPAPFFLFLNYFDAHHPYDPPGGGAFLADGIGRGGAVADYDGEIAFLDVHVGRLLQFLRDRGLLDRTLVIVTADHGEYFGEHGVRTGHPPLLYEPVLTVPLLVRLPAAESRGRVARWTGLHEVRGLVREVVAGQGPLSILEPRRTPVPLSEAWSGSSLEAEPSSVAIYFGDFKLLANRPGRDELFNLADDPGEARDLLQSASPATAAVHAEMRKVLTIESGARMGEMPELPPDAIERLKALGYVQ